LDAACERLFDDARARRDAAVEDRVADHLVGAIGVRAVVLSCQRRQHCQRVFVDHLRSFVDCRGLIVDDKHPTGQCEPGQVASSRPTGRRRARARPPRESSHARDGRMSLMTAPARRVSACLRAIAPSATRAVDAKAKALKAAGRPVIGFGAGEPDFPTPDFIVEAAVAAARDPKNHRYTPATGLPELREAISAKTLRDSGYEVDPANVIVANGGKQAVFQAYASIV